ncbi:unnamed protein product [Symbiodinium pilosum]|uniref:Protein kinase domain-containing protein n=1 Tax=Symbiodinium pilosum TaxID=2952 RepID=A0A812RGC5_SYMPI|nr:unnamed protein product [Symbiodinium pilosum]
MSAPEIRQSGTKVSTPKCSAHDQARVVQVGPLIRLPSPVPTCVQPRTCSPVPSGLSVNKAPPISDRPIGQAAPRGCDRESPRQGRKVVCPNVATVRNTHQRPPAPVCTPISRSPPPRRHGTQNQRTAKVQPSPCKAQVLITTSRSLPFGSPEVQPSEIQRKTLIGSGSFGSVWKACCRGREVAVKICQQTSPSERRVTLQELDFLRNLNHPRLVSFLGFAQTSDQLFFVMELMAGGSLSDLLFCKRLVLSFRQKALMGSQIAEGLSYLHERHVIHRDLKTMNVVLDGSLNCKICDFGLTLCLDHSHVTVCGLQGSPRYMAPEQLETEVPVRISEKVDIWQMGCVMLELFCGVVPFSGLSNVAAIISELIIKKKGPAIPDDADPRARALMTPCLRMSPRSRPTADTLLDVLARVVKNRSTDAVK